jgi:hypothetical protein
VRAYLKTTTTTKLKYQYAPQHSILFTVNVFNKEEGVYSKIMIKMYSITECWWLMPVILAT